MKDQYFKRQIDFASVPVERTSLCVDLVAFVDEVLMRVLESL